MKLNYLIAGAGGFIGGHTAKKLIEEGHNVTCVDIKPFSNWFQTHDESKNISLDLRNLKNCEHVVEGNQFVINMACNMGGIEVWGNGEQTRSYLFIDDCVDATLNLFNSKYHGPINIGSENQVSINQMIRIIEEIANYEVSKSYNLEMPVGVRGRSSNNDKIKSELNWEPSVTLREGLEKTYKWIYDMMTSNKNNSYIYTIS